MVRHNFAGVVIAILLLAVGNSSVQAQEHPLRRAIQLAEEAKSRVDRMPGYEATFYKKEVVANTTVTQKMRMKIRHNPFSVYLYFEGNEEGREVLYVSGRNNGNLLAHDTGIKGLIGTLELSPTGSQAMSENRHPITRAGMSNAVKTLLQQWNEETAYGETEVSYRVDAKVSDMTCRVIESTHPRPRRQFRFHKSRLWIDEASGLPVRIQQFGFPARPGAEPPILEDYVFYNVKSSVQLTDRDFDRTNPKYNF